MTAQGALTEQDVLAAREGLAAGRSVTLWFTAAAVGVPPGGSAKVVAVGDPADGDFIQVRPARSRDTVFCSPNELTSTRPARRRAPREEPETTEPTKGPTKGPGEEPSSPVAPTATQVEPAAPAEPPAAPARPRTRAGSRSRADRSAGRAEAAETTVSLTATADGEWSVEVRVGTKLVVPPASMQAPDVATAARSLPPAVAEVVTSVLEGARHRQRERVEQLRAELDAAQRALEQLGD